MPGRRVGRLSAPRRRPRRRHGSRARRRRLERGDAGVPIRHRGGRNHVDFGNSLDTRARVRQHAARGPPRVGGRRRESLAGVRSERPDGAVARDRPASGSALHVPLHIRRANQRDGAFTTAPAPTADRRIRFAISGDAMRPRAERRGGVQPLPDLRAHGGGAKRFQHQSRRHHLLRQRRRRPASPHSSGEVAEVQARPRATAPRQAPRVDRPLQPLGRSRVRRRLLPLRAWRRDLRRRSTGLPRLLACRLQSREWSLSQCPLGEAPRALLPRRALVPEREGHASCGNDLAPTAPQPVRDAFASLAPGLRAPVPLACLAAINDPTRTMLGARQYAAFTNAIKASRATWKVIVNEVPIQQYYALPYDRWEGYAAERERLLRSLQANTKNVVFLTTDTHANLINEVRFRTLGAETRRARACGRSSPARSRRTRSRRRSTAFSVSRAAAPRSPRSSSSLGLRTGSGCAVPRIDTYSYAQVTVTARTLTVAPLDAAGRPVREATGVACAPLVLAARR